MPSNTSFHAIFPLLQPAIHVQHNNLQTALNYQRNFETPEQGVKKLGCCLVFSLKKTAATLHWGNLDCMRHVHDYF